MSTTTQETEAVAQTASKPDLISTIASEVEGLTKAKAIKIAATLAENIETSYFKLGGVLKVIHTNGWFEGYESFELFVYEKFGFQARKAQYLMNIYDQLVTKQIPWEKVQALGWTKLKDLAAILTPENVDEWVAKALPVTVVQLQAMLKATMPSDTEGGTANTTSDVTVMKFKLKNDQVETVNAALASVKAQVGTDHDNVALEALCAGHLAGVSGTPAGATEFPTDPAKIAEIFSKLGYESVLEAFDKAFPEINITVQV